LEPGDSVLFCTDGITDAFNVEEEPFGIARIQEICEANPYASPTELLAQIFAALAKYTLGREQHDDMTAAVFQCEESHDESRSIPAA
jgi:sigma-B regulation protein RsbU (phosphoserine phosphatase)